MTMGFPLVGHTGVPGTRYATASPAPPELAAEKARPQAPRAKELSILSLEAREV
jgi:hypothetical protein